MKSKFEFIYVKLKKKRIKIYGYIYVRCSWKLLSSIILVGMVVRRTCIRSEAMLIGIRQTVACLGFCGDGWFLITWKECLEIWNTFWQWCNDKRLLGPPRFQPRPTDIQSPVVWHSRSWTGSLYNDKSIKSLTERDQSFGLCQSAN